MEALIVLVIMLLIIVILSGSIFSAAMILMGLFALALGLMVLFFLLSLILFVVSKRSDARLVDFTTVKKIQFARYESDGEVYTNLYPAETFMRDKIYENPEKTIRILNLGKRRTCLDPHTRTIILVGLLLSIISFAAVIAEISILLS